MKKGIIFIVPLGAKNKKEPVFKEILSLCPENDYSSVLYLCPNNFVQTTVKSQFFSYLKKTFTKSAYIPFQSTTIKQFAAHLHNTYGRNNTFSDRIRTLILCEILKEKNIGYARLLSDLLKKIKHYILDKDLSHLKEEIKLLMFEENAAKRAERAIEVLALYEDELKKKDIIDPEDMLKNCIPLLGEFANINVLVIDGFFDPTPLELKIIEVFINKAANVYMIVEENSEIHRYFQTSKSGFTTKRLKQAWHRDNTGYYSYPSMEEEVEGIARCVKKLLIEGVRTWEITVSFPVLSKYLPMLRRIFKKYNIPLSIREHNLSTTQPFIALQEMITCLEEDYPRNDFLSFLISPYFPSIPDIIRVWAVTYSYKAGIVKGKDSWLSIKEILMNSPKGEFLEDNKKMLGEFQQGINSIIETMEDIKNSNGLLSFIDAFESALNKFGFFESIDSFPTDVDGDTISHKITNLFSELRHFGGLYESGLYNSDTPGFYLRYLLQNVRCTNEIRDGVRVIPYELSAGLETTALFFGGMLEGDFPSRPDIDPLLPEKVKKALGMPYLEYYLNRQQLYFRRLLNVSANTPYFSFPSADSDKIFLPSPFLDWKEHIRLPALDIFTEEDVLIREGAIQITASESKIFRDLGATRSGEELFLNKKAAGMLLKRISKMSKGFLNVTDLDYYRKCPLRFYIEKVLLLEIDMPPKYEVESRLWGSLAHKTMENLFRDGDIELHTIDEKLFQGLDQSLKQFPIGDFWSRVAKEIFQKLLPLLKDQETDIRKQGFYPYMVEKKIKTEIHGLKLKGKIDRIDKKVKVGGHTTDDVSHNTVILLDYKTGTIDTDSLQLPLYAGIWQKNFSETVQKVGFYSLREGCISWFPRRKRIEDFIKDTLQSAEELIDKMKKGIFSPEPFKAGECRYCYHSPLCDKESSNRLSRFNSSNGSNV